MFHIFNYTYAKKCLKMIAENEVMKKTYGFKITSLGVLYTILKIDKEIPADSVHKVFNNNLAILGDALTGMNLDGVVKTRYEKIDDVDDDNLDYYKFEVYPIGYVGFATVIFLFWCGLALLLYYVYRHHAHIADWCMMIYTKIKAFF